MVNRAIKWATENNKSEALKTLKEAMGDLGWMNNLEPIYRAFCIL